MNILTMIDDWIKSLLSEGIKGSLSVMFQDVNSRVGGIAGDVGTPPQEWNTEIFTLLKTLSETVIVPIAGLVIAFVLCGELIGLVSEKNNLRDFDTLVFFKFALKSFVAVLLVTHTFDLTMAVFQVAQDVVRKSAGLIQGSGEIGIGGMLENLDAVLMEMPIWQLMLMNAHVFVIQFAMRAISVVIMLVLYSRIIEIYMLCAIGPIPMATLMNREIGAMGQNYLKSIAALAFQGFFIMVCVAIYTVLVKTLPQSGDIINGLWLCTGYTILLCFSLFKSGSFAKSVFNAR